MTASQHFVTFESPGTFFHESTTKPINDWNVDAALALSKDIVERYGAKPFCFYFSTRSRNDDELDSKEIARSGRYFLGGKVYTYEEVVARNDPTEEILRSNMRCNNIARVHQTTSGWKSTNEFNDNDVLLNI